MKAFLKEATEGVESISQWSMLAEVILFFSYALSFIPLPLLFLADDTLLCYMAGLRE